MSEKMHTMGSYLSLMLNLMWNTSSQNIELEKKTENILGRDSFGVVYQGQFAGQDVDVKVINRHWNHQYWDKLQNEAIVLDKNLRHPNVIEMLKYEDRYPPMPEVWIAMELCEESLQSYLDNNSLDVLPTLDVLLQCATGLCFLHDSHLVHRDVKPDNFVIKIEDSKLIMKVTDFSLSKDIEGLLEAKITTIHGNRHWLAPEMFDDDGRKAEHIRFTGSSLQKIDVFSFALIILYTCPINEGRKHICEKYELRLDMKLGKDVLGYFSGQWSSEILKPLLTPLLTQMLNVNAETRPSMNQVCELLRLKMTGPKIVSSVPRLELQNSHQLDYEGVWLVGIGGSHLILLGSKNDDTLHLVQLQGDSYKQLWQKARPEGVSYSDWKYVADDDSLITRDWGYDPTRCWSRDLDPLHTHTLGDGRGLIAVLPLHTHVYIEVTDGGRQLVLYDGDRRGPTLRPPAGTRWGEFLSMCQHPESGFVAVTDMDSWSLDVFDSSGVHKHRVRLDYEPDSRDAITSASSHLVVGDLGTTVLHFHAWDGKAVGRVDLRQVAELGEEDTVYCVRVCQGNILHVAVGRVDHSRLTVTVTATI